MKYFLVKVDIRDGEAEYPESFIVKAENLDEAEKITEKQSYGILGIDDYRLRRRRSIQEISSKEAKTVERLGLSFVAN